MHCWKSINVKKQYGSERLFLLSVLTGFGVFASFYVTLNILYSNPLSDQHFIYFVLALLAIHPVHKLFHFLPLVGCLDNVRLIMKRQCVFIPVLMLRIQDPVNKRRFICALLTPFLLINTAIILLCAAFPAYVHYFSLLLAYHSGLCLIDLLYVRNALRSPKHALIEETDTGYEILVPPAGM